MLLPLEIPAGVYKNGTEYQAKGRWYDANFIRFTNNTIRPIKGWRRIADTPIDGLIRGMVAWRALNGDKWVAGGTSSKLYVYLEGRIQSDITPTGLAAGRVDATNPVGFGNNYYGTSFYGVERPVSDTLLPATTWQLDTFGQYLLACSDDDGKIYEWQLDTATKAAQVSNAPIDNTGIVVTEERFLFCLGAGGNPKLVQWADRESLTDWTPLATNEAGDLELQTQGDIQCGIRVQNQTLIVTTNDAHVATYQGPPYVYGFERVGSACGIIGKKAIAAVDAGAFWMGEGKFYNYAGGSVREIPCEVSDHVFGNINTNQVSKVFAVSNAENGEVWWFYPDSSNNENNRYVAYNYLNGSWMVGQIARTAGVDSGVFTNPVMSCHNGSIHQHEVGYSYDGSLPYIESGPIELGNGDNTYMVSQMIPDEVNQGDVKASLSAKFYPNSDPITASDISMTNPTDIRLTGRQVKIKLEAVASGDFRIGLNRLEVKQGSRR